MKVQSEFVEYFGEMNARIQDNDAVNTISSQRELAKDLQLIFFFSKRNERIKPTEFHYVICQTVFLVSDQYFSHNSFHCWIRILPVPEFCGNCYSNLNRLTLPKIQIQRKSSQLQ